MSDTRSDERAVAALLERRDEAHRGKDAAAISASYAPEAVRYDLAPPLLHRGMQRQELDQSLATWDGPVTITNDDLDITVDGALAVAHGITRMQGRQGDVDQDLWFRSTIVLKRAGDQWAALDLRP